MSASRPRTDELSAAARAVAAARSSGCPPEERLLALHARSLSPADEEDVRDHLAVCDSCGETSRDARRFLDAMAQRRPTRSAWRLPLAAAAGLLLALGAAWTAVLLRGREPQPQAAATAAPAPPARAFDAWADLAIAKAPYAPAATVDEEIVFRGESGGEAAPSAFSRAMEAYARDDFAAAERDLGAHLRQDPGDRRASFYRGVSLLLLGRAGEARPPLTAAAEGQGAAALEARYYLALACLRSGEAAAAEASLLVVERDSPARRDEARALLRRLRAAGPR